ncbi:MAG: hypothetical protein JWP64_3641 [Pseudonocardia sp.]|jgi:hypothetical protein|uniref:hypothetical protein n=1 Tax=Pseudonocardia sp. TaxID=60912 RepID=UPI0026138BE1|nr:hypothetical protein [Pseudonocardia sp.]MCU1628692.1 hypothetical protein [Pseudonocardia sp.]MDT7702568.1 hypothetical protein [Pseudonocardiales bacterium]
MNARTRRSLIAVAVGVAVLPLVGVGAAYAAQDTQSPLQGVDAGQATAETAVRSFVDGVNGDNRPDGANGLESEFMQLDPRFVEGPAGGLVKNGPLE